ncbi:para-aminobenzoate synthase Pab [Nitzschia inconspicua]|uniref:aminodeoxychorismate synthase n=1 Tax=Nitzschia inconspicua TaxID=303405 RepID=A0A9K3KHQ5_9STRA|nr:para-aminobenzoate synthase Pab [Nitzschia inconspicua]
MMNPSRVQHRAVVDSMTVVVIGRQQTWICRRTVLQRIILLLLPLSLQAFLLSPRKHSRIPTATTSSSWQQQRLPSTTTTTTTTIFFFPHSNVDEHHQRPMRPLDGRISSSLPHQKYNVSLLLIDHYDSFTYNLYDMLAQLTVHPPVVVTKDAKDVDLAYLEKFDGIILSPGPGSPHEQPLLSHEAIQKFPHKPVLGVCLGHQLMALAYGATVDCAPKPIHGQDHWIVQQGHNNNVHTMSQKDGTTNDGTETASSRQQHKLHHPSLLESLPSSFRVVRYHSICAYNLPDDELVVTATSSDDNVVQAIQHLQYPHYGVQFHPESIGTQHGMDILKNFVEIVVDTQRQQEAEEKPHATLSSASSRSHQSTTAEPLPQSPTRTARFRVMMHKVLSSVQSVVEPLQVFERYYAHQRYSVWLDSSSYPSRGELDILAAPSRRDNDSDVLEYFQGHDGRDILSRLEDELFGHHESASTIIGWIPNKCGNLTLDETLIEWRDETSRECATTDIDTPPFHYRGGYLGFLGYEVRHDTQRYLQHRDNTNNHATPTSRTNEKHGVPTAAFFLARQSMLYHHPTESWYLIGLVEKDEDIQENLEWMNAILQDFDTWEENEEESPYASTTDHFAPTLEFIPSRSKATYEQDIADCHEHIRRGDSYELCLTNQLQARVGRAKRSTADLYKRLRRGNPAPYSAYFRWNLPSSFHGDNRWIDCPQPSSLVICSSSPERFMSVSREQPHPEIPPFLQAEAKPIKGTRARVIPQNGISRTDAEAREDERRARSLELSLKNRAENLMIVDLLRNDLSRVCKVGSVHVSKLMDIESFATVHQMVSTIRGTLSESKTSIDLLRASFPGGSMTGAPKIRTMELLEELEQQVERGPYSGSLGYLSVNGCMDMNIIIRSAVLAPSTDDETWKVSIGAGGAITALSEAQDEYEEMQLKARAVVAAVQDWASKPGMESSKEMMQGNKNATTTVTMAK